MSMKRRIFGMLAPIALFLLRAFFSREYLRGRFFESSRGGFVWAARAAWSRNVLRLGRPYPWPVALTCSISDPDRITFHPDDLNNFQSPGTYFQNFAGRITLGKGCLIAPNVGIITANHDMTDLQKHAEGRNVVIGDDCWLGMNSVVLPGVVLGPRTVVAAGAVVTKSFPDGGVVIGGMPAKLLRRVSDDSGIDRSLPV
jgi:hypothetical protein